ncbi:FecR domain-containing protein [Niveispirillum sp.]|uniref:FecR family protein n=1 Tax=Niveispirillum sp. TaxID=1917217 RepID=UPI001B721B03|nr:FecR domain-containing protein [Niveispirillum sp.]MBP7337796.1 FecR domain-containing protein [Niveispirillum sp.]
MAEASDIPGDSDPGAKACARADREATDWLILLQEVGDDAGTRARFDAWLHASPLNAAAWAETRHAAAVIEGTPPAYTGYWIDLPGAAPSPSLRPINRAGTRRTYQRRAPWVAAAAVAACLAVVAAPSLLLHLRADYWTGTGEMRSVHLADGSSVFLGAASALAVDFAGGNRKVRLLKGEAYFEVRHDPDHPFRVAANGVETTVLGTGFEVRVKEEGVEVAVRHGLVQVDDPDAARPLSERLATGEKISAMRTGDPERGQTKPDQIAAWTHGQLVANDRAVQEVIDALRPWYRGVIIATGDRLDGARVTGVYDLHDPQAALQALAHAHGAAVQQISPWVTVISFN